MTISSSTKYQATIKGVASTGTSFIALHSSFFILHSSFITAQATNGTCTAAVISSNDSEDEDEDEDVSGDNGNGDDPSDGSSSKALLLFTKDGGEMSCLLSERPRVTHSDDYPVITSDVAGESYPLTDIGKFTFAPVDASSGIDNVPVDEASFNIDGGVLMPSGFREGSTVRIFTMGGMMVHSETLDGGSCTYCMSALSPGICLVNVNDKTFKIAKK